MLLYKLKTSGVAIRLLYKFRPNETHAASA
jgi:hypothetical protein